MRTEALEGDPELWQDMEDQNRLLVRMKMGKPRCLSFTFRNRLKEKTTCFMSHTELSSRATCWSCILLNVIYIGPLTYYVSTTRNIETHQMPSWACPGTVALKSIPCTFPDFAQYHEGMITWGLCVTWLLPIGDTGGGLEGKKEGKPELVSQLIFHHYNQFTAFHSLCLKCAPPKKIKIKKKCLE